MTRRLQALAQTVCIVLILILFPGTARLQEQKETVVPQQGQSGAKPATQESGPSVAPVPETQAPADAPLQQKDAATSPGEPVEGESVASAEQFTSYIIKKGDTLWDIANTFLKDPFLWPFIWKANPSITNPDLIFAGNTLAIPGLAPIERAMKTGTEPKTPPVEKQAAAEEQVQTQDIRQREGIAAAGVIHPKPAPSAATAAEEEVLADKSGIVVPEVRILPIIDKYAMLSAGFINDEKTEDFVVGAREKGKSVLGYDDILYVSIQGGENISIGDKYLIFTPLQKVKHPKTGRNFGKLIKGLGILQITAKNPSVNVLTARVTLSFDAIEIGNMLIPYQEPVLIYPSPQKKGKDISGYILEVMDKRSINAQADFVYLDKGTADGVEPGDQFLVYVKPEKRNFPREVIGELQVILVKEHTATALVRKSTEPMSKGDAVAFKN